MSQPFTQAHSWVAEAFDKIDDLGDDAVFVSVADRDWTLRAVNPELPLAGTTIAVKDNIDVIGLPTSLACPSFTYMASRSAHVVSRLVEAGASVIGKTNMDQFSVGLVGTRSPHGIPRNVIDPKLIPGGSSSGSAVAVASGVVDVALGTDTIGSGRVPAAHNQIAGLKPTRGRLSTSGVVPSVKNFDCISIFANAVSDGWKVLTAAEGYDSTDTYSRKVQPPPSVGRRLRIGVAQNPEFDSLSDASSWQETIRLLQDLGLFTVSEVSIDPLISAAELFHEGPWVADRFLSVGGFLSQRPSDANPTVRQVITEGAAIKATAFFEADHRLRQLKREANRIWETIDILIAPTIPGVVTLSEETSDPVGRNTRLGRYTTGVNLFDMCAVAIPGVDRRDGLPFSISVLGPAWADPSVAKLSALLHEGQATGIRSTDAGDWTEVSVAGCHLSGMSLNWQLTTLGAELVRTVKTANSYRLYALETETGAQSALIRAASGGDSVEAEVWRIPTDRLGAFAQQLPTALALGSMQLNEGEILLGVVAADNRVVVPGGEVTMYGGWRAFVASLASD